MSETIQIFSHSDPGYKAPVRFDGWRVAMLNFGEKNDPANITYFECHYKTDETFVLMEGRCILLTAAVHGDMPEVTEMEHDKLYNIPKDVWHTCLLSKDAKVCIVENIDTGRDNSEKREITSEMTAYIADLARKAGMI